MRLISLAAVLIAGCARVPFAQPPDALRPAGDEAPFMKIAATGVQIYECSGRKDGAGHEWKFVAPEAQLLDSHGRLIGQHGAGPNWQLSDGSRVVGTVKARADAPVAEAIPWLLLTAKSTGARGALAGVTRIQRVNTVGGIAPVTPCNNSSTGTQARVAYTADYIFFSAN